MKRVLDLLEPGDLKLGQVVIKRVAVVEPGVNNGSGDGGVAFPMEWVCVATYLLNADSINACRCGVANESRMI